MLGHNTLGKRIASACLAVLTALQPLTGYAQSIGEAIRNSNQRLPHVLPIADRADVLPLPYLPPQRATRADGVSKDSQKAAVVANDDDDYNILPAIIAALKPKCAPLTASVSTAVIGESITLSANCSITGNLARKFVLYRTDLANPLTYISDASPLGAVTFATIAPSPAGTYTYNVIAMNGSISSNAAAGAVVTVGNKALTCALAVNPPFFNRPAALTATCMSNAVAVSGASVAWSANTGCAPNTTLSDGTASCTTPAVATAVTFNATATKTDHVTATSSVTVTPTALLPMSCNLAFSPSSLVVGTVASLIANCTSNGTVVIGATYTWTGSAAICGTTSSAACSITPSSTSLLTYGTSASKAPNYSPASASVQAAAKPAVQTLQCSLTANPAKSSYSANDTFTLSPTCSAGGYPVSASRLSVQSWSVDGGNAFATQSCGSTCAQTLNDAHISANPFTDATYTYTYAVTVSGIGYTTSTPSIVVPVNNAFITNGSFELSYLGDAPTSGIGTPPFGYFKKGADATTVGRGWVFTADGGIQTDGSAFSQSGPFLHDGAQTALLQATGSASYTAYLPVGAYTLSYQAANRTTPNSNGQQTVQVSLDGSLLKTFSPGTSFANDAVSFSITAAGNHTIMFAGTTTTDTTAFIDKVVLTRGGSSSVTAPSGCQIVEPTASATTGQQVSLSVSCSIGTTPFTYSWLRGSTALPATSTVNDTPFTTQNSATTPSASYTVTVSNAAGSAAVTRNISNSAYTGTPPPGTETLTFLHPNLTGSTIMATNASGAVLWREDYQAYGERIRKESSSTIAAGTNPAAATATNNRAWFTGKLHDETTGLSYFGARYYDPQVGRFMGFDPHGFEERSPLSFNRYAYANNNPVKFVDPDGRQAVQIAVAVGLGIAASTMAPSAGKNDGVRAGGMNPVDPTQGIKANPAQAPTAAQIMSFPLAAIQLASALSSPIHLAAWASQILASSIAPNQPNGNGNPYKGPVTNPVVVVDRHGNAIPVGPGQSVATSPNGDFQQVLGADGKPTGDRLDRGGHPGQRDPRAQQPHGHRPGVTTPDGNPHLPVSTE